MKQSIIFLKGEAARWWDRNRDKIDPYNDPVIKAIEVAGIRPQRVLEYGCADGWRLCLLDERFDLDRCVGVDPLGEGMPYWPKEIRIHKLTCDAKLLYSRGEFDLIIFGFCLYLCDREDLFGIVCEADRLLMDGGHIIIHDFNTYVEPAFSRVYEHDTRVKSYHMNHGNMFLSHPFYKRVCIRLADDLQSQVDVLRKHVATAFPVRP